MRVIFKRMANLEEDRNITIYLQPYLNLAIKQYIENTIKNKINILSFESQGDKMLNKLCSYMIDLESSYMNYNFINQSSCIHQDLEEEQN